MRIFLGVVVLCCATDLACANETFEYEKLHDFGIGKRPIPNFRRMYGFYQKPQPLPKTKMPAMAQVRDPFPRLYQGVRRRSLDKRVFTKEFDYEATNTGHRILCESLVECEITHVAIETEDGIPIILRGGVGYRHFSIVVRAKPGDPLKGTIRIYCNKLPEESQEVLYKFDQDLMMESKGKSSNNFFLKLYTNNLIFLLENERDE